LLIWISRLLATGRVLGGIMGFWGFINLLSGGAVTALLAGAIFGPWGWIIIVCVLLIALLLSMLYLSSSGDPGIYKNRYLDWYKLPFRRISFDFDNYLGMGSREGENIEMSRFQARMKVNWGTDIKPSEAFIRSNSTGKNAIVRFRTSTGYKGATEATLTIPVGKWFYLAADFEALKPPGDSVPVEDFLREFSGFDLVIKWEDGSFTRTFPRSELEFVIDGFRKYSNPEPYIQIKTGEQPPST
jgi:hypothetical protein